MADKRNLAQMIVKHLKEERESGGLDDDAMESLEISIQCIEQAYKLDENPVQLSANAKSLLEIYANACTVSQADKQLAEKHKAEGNEYMKGENYQEAIASYTQAIKCDDGNAVYFCNRAAAYTALHEYPQAIADCEQAIKIDANYGKAYGRMGLACINAKEYQKAATAYQRAVELEPNNSAYKQNLELANERVQAGRQQPAMGGGGAPNPLGGLDLSNLLQNPAVMNMAASFMQNPQMQSMFANMMGNAQNPNEPANPTTTPTPTSETAAPPPTSAPQPSESSDQSEASREFQQATGFQLPEGLDLNQVLGATQNFAQQMRETNPELVEQLRQQFQSGPQPQPPPSQ